MNYTEIEMEWMKEILRDKEEEIKKLKSDLSLVIKERDDNIKQNKKLKVIIKNNDLEQKADWKHIEKLEEQNKKMSEENGQLKKDLAFKNTMLDNVRAEYDSSLNIIKKLEERIRFLEQCLDNKEKVNKSLREENKRLSDFLECEA